MRIMLIDGNFSWGKLQQNGERFVSTNMCWYVTYQFGEGLPICPSPLHFHFFFTHFTNLIVNKQRIYSRLTYRLVDKTFSFRTLSARGFQLICHYEIDWLSTTRFVSAHMVGFSTFSSGNGMWYEIDFVIFFQFRSSPIHVTWCAETGFLRNSKKKSPFGFPLWNLDHGLMITINMLYFFWPEKHNGVGNNDMKHTQMTHDTSCVRDIGVSNFPCLFICVLIATVNFNDVSVVQS